MNEMDRFDAAASSLYKAADLIQPIYPQFARDVRLKADYCNRRARKQEVHGSAREQLYEWAENGGD